jgi:hypothetical protein
MDSEWSGHEYSTAGLAKGFAPDRYLGLACLLLEFSMNHTSRPLTFRV